MPASSISPAPTGRPPQDPVTDPANLLASPVPAFAVPSSDAKGRAAAAEGGRSGHSLDLESITPAGGAGREREEPPPCRSPIPET